MDGKPYTIEIEEIDSPPKSPERPPIPPLSPEQRSYLGLMPEKAPAHASYDNTSDIRKERTKGKSRDLSGDKADDAPRKSHKPHTSTKHKREERSSKNKHGEERSSKLKQEDERSPKHKREKERESKHRRRSSSRDAKPASSSKAGPSDDRSKRASKQKDYAFEDLQVEFEELNVKAKDGKDGKKREKRRYHFFGSRNEMVDIDL